MAAAKSAILQVKRNRESTKGFILVGQYGFAVL